MRVLIALDLNDDDLSEAYGINPRTGAFGHEWDDLYLSLGARAEEVYCGTKDHPVRGTVVALGDFTGALEDLLSAAEVGAEGHPDDAVAGHLLGSIQSMRETL